jgi:hypothetical protein
MIGTVASLLVSFDRMAVSRPDLRAADVVAALRDRLPSGSGFDAPPTVEIRPARRKGAPPELRIRAPFHLMNGAGFYVGWTTYRITVRPAWNGGIDVTIRGPDADGLREYVADTYHHALTRPAEAAFTAGEGWRLLPLPAPPPVPADG